MPIFEYTCTKCGQTMELLLIRSSERPVCPACGSVDLEKKLSAHSSMSGPRAQWMPGHGDTTCCGHSPAETSCAGPGSCCGRR